MTYCVSWSTLISALLLVTDWVAVHWFSSTKFCWWRPTHSYEAKHLCV